MNAGSLAFKHGPALRLTSLIPALGVLLALAACVNAPPPAPEPVPEPEPLPAPPPPPPPPPNVDEALHWALPEIESGRLAEARDALGASLAYHGRQPMAAWIYDQLSADPVQLLGPPAREHAIAAGETLGQLAADELGHPLWYIALARYNGITDPRRLTIGQKLRLPAARPDLPAFLASKKPSGVAAAARQLLADGRHEQAISLLSTAQAGGTLGADGTALLVEALARRIEPLIRRGAFDDAAIQLATARSVADQPDGKAIVERLENRLNAERHYRQGLEAFGRGQTEAAHFSFSQALRYDRDHVEAKVRLAELNEALTAREHQEAVRRYNAGDLVGAGDLWRKILELDPENRLAREFLAKIEKTGETAKTATAQQ